MTTIPSQVQEEILNILESDKKKELIQSSNMKKGRLIINLKRKYDFETKGICLS
ncbi:MAG: hypothetical protein ACI8Q1_000905 [Parvicella sp.]|jgi:hypothetical protein